MRTLAREEREKCDRIAEEVEQIAEPISLHLLLWLWNQRDEHAELDRAGRRSW